MANKLEYYDIMEKAFANHNLSLSHEAYEQFMTYMALIQEWNQKINLTAITEDEDIINLNSASEFKKSFRLPFLFSL